MHRTSKRGYAPPGQMLVVRERAKQLRLNLISSITNQELMRFKGLREYFDG